MPLRDALMNYIVAHTAYLVLVGSVLDFLGITLLGPIILTPVKSANNNHSRLADMLVSVLA